MYERQEGEARVQGRAASCIDFSRSVIVPVRFLLDGLACLVRLVLEGCRGARGGWWRQ